MLAPCSPISTVSIVSVTPPHLCECVPVSHSSKIQILWLADSRLYTCPSGQALGEENSDFFVYEIYIFKLNEIKYSIVRLSSRIDMADGELMKICNLNWKFSSKNSLKVGGSTKKMENLK